MAETVITLQKDGKSPDQAQCHLMPCRIEHEGQTVKSKEYFWPTIKELRAGGDDEQGRERNHAISVLQGNTDAINPILTASFRGRPLQGRKIQIPEEYKGYLVRKESDRNKTSLKSFDDFTYWNWDELPSDNDTVVKALQWINISKAIHGYPEEGCSDDK